MRPSSCQSRYGGNPQFGGQVVKGPPNLIPQFACEDWVWRIRLRNLIGEFTLQPLVFQVVQGDVGSDPPRPGHGTSSWVKSRVRAIHSPECFHRQVLRCGGVSDDANDPAIDLGL